MASHMESNHVNKDADFDVRELFNLLDSANITDVTEIKDLVQEKLISNSNTWILNSLVEYYYITSSKEAIDILINVKAPHDKHLVDKISEGIRGAQHRLKAVQLLLHVVCKEPTWIHTNDKIISQSVFGALMKCLKNETDVPILMTGVMSLTVLLPSIPTYLGHQLSTIFEVFSHLMTFSHKKPGSPSARGTAGNVPDVYLLHLQVALYSLFHRLYGMFPYTFLAYLRTYYGKKDNIAVYEECVKPMLERVRLHPGLITGNRDAEVSNSRWRTMEIQDVVMECAKMSLDVMEGMWDDSSESLKKNILYKPLDQSKSKDITFQNRDSSMLRVPDPIPFSGNQADTFFSPSIAIGMSTPPPSQRNTPATNVLETSSSTHAPSAPGTHGNTPVITPRATPPIFEDAEKGLSRNSSRGSLFTKGSDKRASLTIVTKSQPGSDVKSSVPPSPIKTEFTAEPPTGMFKSLPIRTTARELKFDIVPESPIASFVDHGMMYHPSNTKEEKDDGIEHVTIERKDSLERPDLMESFSMETLPKMMEDLHGSDEDDEVSEITQNQSESRVHLTAESVAQFMKSVNRIRFNSLTATNNLDLYKQERYKKTRSNSCPSLPKLSSVDNEDSEDENEEELSRSTSMVSNLKRQISQTSQQDSPQSSLPVVTTVTTETSSVTMTTSSHISITSCPVFTQSDNQPVPQSQNSFMDVIKNSLLPNSMHLCQRCKTYMVSDKNQGKEVPLFQSLSPLELLDKHLTMGREIHAKELSKIPITSQDAINWTHFGGAPPADEINILRGQIIMMENQLMYERHKRELHNKRNRRLLRKIANAETLEENNNVMAGQINILETEIQNFKISTKLLQDENRKLKDLQESNEYEMLVKLRSCLQENSDLKSTKTELNTLLVRQREEQDALKKKLQESENKLFHNQQEISHLKEQGEIAQKLKDQMLQTHKELMLMGELQQKYQENININKYRNNKQPEHDMVVSTLKAEIKVLQAQLDRDSLQLTACQQRIVELEENVKNKDVWVTELKKKLEDVKISQEDEIKSIEDKYQSVMKINQGLEGKLLQLYSQVDELRRPTQTKGASFSPLHEYVDSSNNRNRTESDPSAMEIAPKQTVQTVYKFHSVPANDTFNPSHTETHNDIPHSVGAREIDGASLVSKESGIEP
ncbi:hamartin-like isoform X3 [Mytilus californianus]|uniref:hamartin-like isoform X3 n=1 Tax=Mytilus californianus TaxID=6549 RepID=UPI0022472058|nr:hamartin-like isoform X3 [Mytilus californianus]